MIQAGLVSSLLSGEMLTAGTAKVGQNVRLNTHPCVLLGSH